ncbi:MAG: hypothetical protein HC880_11240, partial [Bacteroidia bacterium]|nr:hypothetical protein [Bacteroidia bacterium]
MKRQYNMQIKIFLLACLTFALALSSCRRDPNDPGTEYAPQMYVSRPYEPYSQVEYNEINPMGTNVRHPAPNTIARRPYDPNFEIGDSAGNMVSTVDLMVYDDIAPTITPLRPARTYKTP